MIFEQQDEKIVLRMREDDDKKSWEYAFPPFRSILTDGTTVPDYMSGKISMYWRNIRRNPQTADFLHQSGTDRLRYTEWPESYLEYTGVPDHEYQYMYIQEPWFLYRKNYFHKSMPELWPIQQKRIQWMDAHFMPKSAAYAWLKLIDGWLVKAHSISNAEIKLMGYDSENGFENDYRAKMDHINEGRFSFDTNPVIWLLALQPAFVRNFNYMAKFRINVNRASKLQKDPNANVQMLSLNERIDFPLAAIKEDVEKWGNLHD